MAAFISKNTKNGGAQLAPGVPVRAGQVISGKYRVEELLGCSATAIVVTARHVHVRHPVTLKILTAYTDEQAAQVKRQVKKARIASRLRGDHVAKILDIGTTDDGMPYIATERLEGHTLASVLEARGGHLPVEEALRLGLEICEGLAEAHAAGLVHGDLKTKNIFVANGSVKILDFGTATPIEASNDASATAWFGMPSYLAPEQIKDPESIDARADIWSLGAILHELISGSLPFTADTISGVLVAVCCDAAPLLSETSYELARVIHRCLEKEPSARWASVEELAEELGRFLGEHGQRASERVRAALAKRDFDLEGDELDADASGSISPMSVPVDSARASDVSLPLVTRRRAWDQPTAPSQRVVNRRTRARTIAIGTVVAATAIAAAAIISSPPSMPRPGSNLISDDEVVIPSSRDPFEVTPHVREQREDVVLPSPHALPAAVTPIVPPPAHARMFSPPPAPSSQANAQVHPRGMRSGLRLPNWLPGGRDPKVIASAPPKSGAPAPKADETYMRNLFTERK